MERLGTGGMSVVWRGFDEILGREVAVKVLSPQLARDAAFRDRLRQEALAAARLCHPHITGIFDFGESPLSERLTVPYVVMELNDGESVGARLHRDGPLPWRDAVAVAVDVASALATAHARGVVHRDVTPANVMLTSSGAKVVDFGISALVGQRDSAPDGSLLGTPAYLAPERLAGGQVSPATDVYALGLLLYRSLTARLPWPAETTTEALRAHLFADPEPVPRLPGMPEEVAVLCLRCLAKDPLDRPAAAYVAHALAEIIGVQPIIPPVDRAERGRVAVPADHAAGARTPSPLDSTIPNATLIGPRVTAPAPAVPPAADPGRRKRRSPAAGSVPHAPARTVSGSAPHAPAWAVSGSAPHGPARNVAPGTVRRRVRGTRSTRPGTRRPAGASTAAPPARDGRPAPTMIRVLRLRAGLRIRAALRLGAARPLGGGLFAGGRLRRRGVTSGVLLPAEGRGGATARRGWVAFAVRHGRQAAAATLTLLVAVGVAWSANREPADAGGTQAAAAGPGTAAVTLRRSECKVRYQVRRDTGTRFEALVTVVNTSDRAMPGWRVVFSFPGAQRLVDTPRTVVQRGRKVVLRAAPAATLQPRKAVYLTLHGSYQQTNPMPLAFTLDGHPCRAEVLGAAATPDVDDAAPVTEAAGNGRTARRSTDRGSTGTGAGTGAGSGQPTRPAGGAASGRTAGRTSMVGSGDTPDSVPAASSDPATGIGAELDGGVLPRLGGRAGPMAGFEPAPRLGAVAPATPALEAPGLVTGAPAAGDETVEKVKRRPGRAPHPPAAPVPGPGPWVAV
ncbi:hypothetical protein KRMM14A1259_53060 [Krasilnikovia sp. MM14-A1259]